MPLWAARFNAISTVSLISRSVDIHRIDIAQLKRPGGQMPISLSSAALMVPRTLSAGSTAM
jgi:hypothetical protein